MLSTDDADASDSNADLVHLYAKEFLALALLLWFGFHNAIKEGDGKRILRYWKFLLVVFKVEDRRNYAKEAVNLLLHTSMCYHPGKHHNLPGLGVLTQQANKEETYRVIYILSI